MLIITYNALRTPGYLTVGNWVNMFELSIEKIIVALIMTFIIINAEIDLSVASVMGFAACTMGFLFAGGTPMVAAIAAGLAVGMLAGFFNSFWIGVVGLPSLVVTLAGLIGYRGLAYVLLEDRSIGQFPAWFNYLGQQPLIGPFPLAMIIFFVMLVLAIIILAVFCLWPLRLRHRQQQGCRALCRRQGAAHQDHSLRRLVHHRRTGRHPVRCPARRRARRLGHRL